MPIEPINHRVKLGRNRAITKKLVGFLSLKNVWHIGVFSIEKKALNIKNKLIPKLKNI